jgi:hypothetical protein
VIWDWIGLLLFVVGVVGRHLELSYLRLGRYDLLDY